MNNHEIEEARERLRMEKDMLDFQYKKALYLDRMHEALDLEYQLEVKQNEIDEL